MKIQIIQHALQVKKLRLWQVRRESKLPAEILSRKHTICSLLELRAQVLHLLKKKKPTDSSTVVAEPAIKELKRLSDFICCGICSRGGQEEQVIKS